jgi:hypothetical protein
MRTLTALCLSALAALLLLGCGADTTTTEMSPESAATDAKTPEEKIGLQGKAQVIHDPAKATQPGQGYRIEPPNPNDPKFQADPKLAGGG